MFSGDGDSLAFFGNSPIYQKFDEVSIRKQPLNVVWRYFQVPLINVQNDFTKNSQLFVSDGL